MKIYLITHDTYEQRDGTNYAPVAVFVDNQMPAILVTCRNGSVWESKESFPAEVDALRWWIQNTTASYLNVSKNFVKIEKPS